MKSGAVGIVGAGTMGSGIAQVAATSGREVVLFDVTAALAEGGRERIRGALRRSVENGRMAAEAADAAIARIRATDRLADVAAASLVIEVAPERLPVKRTIFAELDAVANSDAVLASNTSSLSIGEIAAATRRPERVVGMHFFNPAPAMALVEIVRGALSADAAVDVALEAARAWKKTPIAVRDTPGFVVNRVARPFHLETFRMLGEGVATIAEIDAAALRGGFRMGPGRLLDLIGIDVNFDVTSAVWEGFRRHPRFEPHPLQREMIAAGTLGRKTGRGFYDYASEPPSEPPAIDDAFAERIALRIVACIVNEAAFALGDGIASAADIETAMKLGTSYPKGPFAWGRELGLDRVRGTLAELATGRPERYPMAQRLASGDLP